MNKFVTHATACQLVQGELKMASAAVKKFAVRFDADPAYAFEWAEEAMDAAASQRVLVEVMAMLNAVEELDEAVAWVRKEADRLARRVPSSTSVCSNRMEQYTSARWVKTAVMLETGSTW